MNDLLDTHDKENKKKLLADVEEVLPLNGQFSYQVYQANHSYHASVACDKTFFVVCLRREKVAHGVNMGFWLLFIIIFLNKT